MTENMFKIIKKDELGEFLKRVLDDYIKSMDWNVNDPKDLAKLNSALDQFSKEMFYL